jgi:hypothetical protein
MITASDLGDEAANVDMLVRKPLRPRQLTTLMADMLARGNRPETMSAD